MEENGKFDLAVIGAGCYGLMVAKTYLEFHNAARIIIFESATSIGGVWAEERLYPGLKSNNLIGMYEYPDFPMDSNVYGVKPGEHIPGHVLHKYFTDFAKHFNIYESIRFHSRVTEAARKSDGQWLLLVESGASTEKIVTERLVVATGMTSDPYRPIIPGTNEFGGPVFHVKDFQLNAEKVIQNSKEIAVLGGTKSAYDVAYAFATAGVKVHMIIRESGHGPMWLAPIYVTPLKVWLEKLVTTRFLTWLSPCIWGDSDGYPGIRNFYHTYAIGRKIVDTFWSILGNDVITINGYDKHPETKKLKPWTNPMFMGAGLGIMNYEQDWLQFVRDGKINIHIADIDSLAEHSVNLANGQTITNIDAFVCSTGWKYHPPLSFKTSDTSTASLVEQRRIDAALGLPHYSLTGPSELSKADEEILSRFPRLVSQPKVPQHATALPADPVDHHAPPNLNQPYRLYRFMVPPQDVLHNERTLAFAGVPMSTITMFVASVQALWITAYFDDKIPLLPPPSSPDSHDHDIEYETLLHSRFGRWRYSGGHGHEYPDFVFDAIPYLDLLLRQLHINPWRKGGRLAEMFTPYGPKDYRGLGIEFMMAGTQVESKA